jgi:hypothetical protein
MYFEWAVTIPPSDASKELHACMGQHLSQHQFVLEKEIPAAQNL